MRRVLFTSLIMGFILFTQHDAATTEKSYRESEGGCSSPVNAGGRKPGIQLNLGYWNDNFVLNNPFGNGSANGRDDFHTASFWLQTAEKKREIWRFLDLYFHLLTDKKRGVRTDLLAVRLSREQDTRLGRLRIGTGIVACGDFGGARLQNGYHKLFHFVPVDVPYSETRSLGWSALLRDEKMFLRTNWFRMGTYISCYYRSAVIPGNLRAGLDGTVTLPSFFPLQLQGIAGGTNYWGRQTFLSPLFDSGFTWGALITGKPEESYRISVWFTNNQYGLHQLQFGLALTFGEIGSRLINLHDFTFP